MDDMLFTGNHTVMVTKFNETKRVNNVRLTAEAVSLIAKDPEYVFSEKEVFWIERNEDYYGTKHYKGKVAVEVPRDSFLSGTIIADIPNPPLKKYRIIIAGGRTFNNYHALCLFMDRLLLGKPKNEIEIVSGTAKGADVLGERYAEERGYSIKRFPADWSIGKHAGYLRNVEMSVYANRLALCWNLKSLGSKHMLDIAKKAKLPTRVLIY